MYSYSSIPIALRSASSTSRIMMGRDQPSRSPSSTRATYSFTRSGARDYDPVTARWTTKDPVGFEGGANVYASSTADFVNTIDPFGLVAIGFSGYASRRRRNLDFRGWAHLSICGEVGLGA